MTNSYPPINKKNFAFPSIHPPLTSHLIQSHAEPVPEPRKGGAQGREHPVWDTYGRFIYMKIQRAEEK